MIFKNSDPRTGRHTAKSDAPKESPKAKKTDSPLADAEDISLESQFDNIRKWLKKVRFKKSVIGGVDESDVWKKISELNSLYETALIAERSRYDALLKERVEQAACALADRYAPAQTHESADGTENVSEEA